MSYAKDLNITSDYRSGFDRIRVDQSQTSFFEGREFRSFHEFNIAPAGAPILFRLVTPINFIVMEVNFDVDVGGLFAEFITGMIDVGPWTPLTVIGANLGAGSTDRRFPYYVGQITTDTGANTAATGGTVVDKKRVRAASQTVSAISVSGSQDSPRLRPAGSYYIRLSVLSGSNDGAQGIFSIRWEERAKHPEWKSYQQDV